MPSVSNKLATPLFYVEKVYTWTQGWKAGETGGRMSTCAALHACSRRPRAYSPIQGLRVPMPLRRMRPSTAALVATRPTPCQAPHCTLAAGRPAAQRILQVS